MKNINEIDDIIGTEKEEIKPTVKKAKGDKRFFITDERHNPIMEIHGDYITEDIPIQRSSKSRKEILYKHKDGNGKMIEISCYHNVPLKEVVGDSKPRISPKTARKMRINQKKTGKYGMIIISGGVHPIDANLTLEQVNKIINALRKLKARLGGTESKKKPKKGVKNGKK